MKKALALLLCLALALGGLAGCGEKSAAAPEDTETVTPAPDGPGDDQQNPQDALTDDLTADEEADAAAAAQAVVDTLTAAWRSHPADETVCTVNGWPVTWGAYYYLLIEDLQDLVYYTGALPSDYTMLLSGEQTLEEYLKEIAVSKAAYYALAQTKAEELGAELTQESRDAIQAAWDRLAENYGGEEALLEAMAEACLDKDVYLFLVEGSEKLAACMETLYGADGEKLPPEELAAWAEENGYVRAKHILYDFYGEDGAPLDDEAKAALLEQARSTLAELRALEDDVPALLERFDELMASDGDDPGMTSFPEGYVFTPGTMVEEFDDAARALADYAVSDVVETYYGYHILLRLPLEPECLTMDRNANTGAYLTLGQTAAEEMFSDDMTRWLGEAEIVWEPGFEDMSLNELFGAGDPD